LGGGFGLGTPKLLHSRLPAEVGEGAANPKAKGRGQKKKKKIRTERGVDD